MRQISSYILRHLLVSMLVITAALSLTVWMTQALRMLELVVNGGAPASMFLQLAMLTLPTFLGTVLPISLVAAVLFTYNRLMTDSELVVMRAAGLSSFALARPALLMAGLTCLMVLALNAHLAPAAHRELVQLRNVARSEFASVLLSPGVFKDIGDDLTVFVRDRADNGELQGILIHDARVAEKPITIVAERGILVQDNQGARVLVHNGNRQELDRKTGRLAQLYFDQYAIDLNIVRSEYGPRSAEPREQDMTDLLKSSKGSVDEKARRQLLAEFHMRLAGALIPLAFVAVALATLMSGEFSRRGQVKRIVFACALVILIQSLILGFANASVRNTEVVLMLYAGVIAPFLAGLWALMHEAVRRPPARARG